MSDLDKSCHRLIKRNAELEKALKDLKSTHKELLHKQKMESITTMTAGIVHDFNNLLSSILGYASLLKMKIDTDNPLYKYAHNIEQSANKAADLTQQLFAFCNGGKSQLQVININSGIEQALHIFEKTMGKGIQTQKSLCADLETIKADPSQIEQAILNLCINAREAMPNGGRLTVSTEGVSLDDEGENVTGGKKEKHVRISISDTGGGIPEEIQDRIFDPFFSTKGKKSGTGLGLSMVYGIIKNHGGRIRVESEPGKGTTFEIILPGSGGHGRNRSIPLQTKGSLKKAGTDSQP